MDNRMSNIITRLGRQYDEVVDVHGNQRVFGVVLYGSQNYLLDTPNSDIDSKAIIIPSFDSIVRADKSTSFSTETKEGLIDYKDIREMFKQYKKQSINFVETLFSPYRYNPSIWDAEWKALENYRERIARFNPYRTVKNASNMAYGCYYAKLIKSIKEYEWETAIKSLCNLIRLEWFIEAYIDEHDYTYCIVPQQLTRDYIREFKELDPYSSSIDSLKSIGDLYLKRINEMSEKYLSKVKDKEDLEIGKIMHLILKSIIRKNLKMEWY